MSCSATKKARLQAQSGDDIDSLINFFIRKVSKQLGKIVEGISPEAIQLLRSYDWPGNVRELQSVIRRSLLMSTGPVIVPENVSNELRGSSANSAATGLNNAAELSSQVGVDTFVQSRIDEGSTDIYAETLGMMELKLITKILGQTSGNQSQAAELLGITRGSLRNKI